MNLKFEDSFRKAINEGAQAADERLRQQWSSILEKIPQGGTDTGERVMQTLAEHTRKAQDALTSSREAGLKFAHTLAQNYATLVNGVLTGLSEAMQQGKPKKK